MATAATEAPPNPTPTSYLGTSKVLSAAEAEPLMVRALRSIPPDVSFITDEFSRLVNQLVRATDPGKLIQTGTTYTYLEYLAKTTKTLLKVSTLGRSGYKRHAGAEVEPLPLDPGAVAPDPSRHLLDMVIEILGLDPEMPISTARVLNNEIGAAHQFNLDLLELLRIPLGEPLYPAALNKVKALQATQLDTTATEAFTKAQAVNQRLKEIVAELVEQATGVNCRGSELLPAVESLRSWIKLHTEKEEAAALTQVPVPVPVSIPSWPSRERLACLQERVTRKSLPSTATITDYLDELERWISTPAEPEPEAEPDPPADEMNKALEPARCSSHLVCRDFNRDRAIDLGLLQMIDRLNVPDMAPQTHLDNARITIDNLDLVQMVAPLEFEATGYDITVLRFPVAVHRDWTGPVVTETRDLLVLAAWNGGLQTFPTREQMIGEPIILQHPMIDLPTAAPESD
jgi:hypothetical protein